MKSQNEALHEYLIRHRKITQRKASRRLGIDRLSARIYELRNKGVRIETNRIRVPSRYGNTVVAEYVYLGEEEWNEAQ